MTPHTSRSRSGRPAGARLSIASTGAPHRGPMAYIALLLVLSTASCSGGGGGGGGFQMPPTPVEITSVEPQTVRDEFRALGSLESDKLIEVVSEINAVVRDLPFREGQAVAQGAVLALLDDSEIAASKERAEAERDRETSDHERAKQLYEEKAISEKELEDARTDLRVAEANYELAKARLDKTRIRAPFSGLVGRRRVSPGAYVSSGDMITELARVNVMRVTFSAPERFVGRLKPGIPVRIAAPAYPGRTFEGRLSVVDPIVDPGTRTVQLVAHVPNRENLLRPGMSADVNVTLAERAEALVVPDEAVFAEGNQSYVYKVNADSTVAKSAVRLGTRSEAGVEVLDGLEPGSMVVRAGHHKLFEGARIMPIGAGPESAAGPGGAAPSAGSEGPADDAPDAQQADAKESDA